MRELKIMNYKSTYLKLADFGRELLSKTSLEEGMPLISKYAKAVIGAQRCSIFIYDNDKKQLWTTLADDIERIEVPSDKGLVGHTLKEKKPLIENKPYSNPHFLPDIDKASGYTTNNIITAPVFNANREIIGVLELLNKEGGYDESDMKFVIFFAHYISGFLDLINHIGRDR